MATYLSPVYQGSKYIPSVPLDIVAQGLSMKQRQADEFRAQNQGVLDALGRNTFYRDADLNYVNDKLKGAVDQVNNFSGQDLTDGRVQGQISGIINGLTADPEVTKRIIANKQRAKVVNDMSEIKEKHPEKWSQTNYGDWKDQDDAWKADPNKIDYTATYQPYHDYSVNENKSMDEIKKNPDIHIDWYEDPVTGQKIKRSDKEIKEITQKKLYGGISTAVTQEDMSQHAIDYRQHMKSVTPQAVGSMIDDEIAAHNAHMEQFKQLGSNPRASKQYRDEANALAFQLEGKIKSLEQTKKDIAMGIKDPGSYYTFGKYVDDRWSKIAQANAFRQDDGYDEMSKIRYQEQMSEKLERFKNELKKKEDSANLPITNNLITAFKYATLGDHGSVNSTSLAALLNIDPNIKISDKEGPYIGTLPFTLNNADISADVKPLIQSQLPGTTLKQADAYSNLYKLYNQQRIITKYGSIPTGDKAPLVGTQHIGPDGNTWDPKATAVANIDVPVYGGTSVGQSSTGAYHQEQSFDEFMRSIQNNQDVVNNYKKSFGIDITKPGEVANIKSAANILESTTRGNMGVKFTKGNGTIHVLADNNATLHPGNDGKYHVSGSMIGTEDEVKNAYGASDLGNLIGTSVIDLHKKDENGNKLYQAHLDMPVTADIGSVMSNYASGQATKPEDVEDITNRMKSQYVTFHAKNELLGGRPTDKLQQLYDKADKLFPGDNQDALAKRQSFNSKAAQMIQYIQEHDDKQTMEFIQDINQTLNIK